MPGDEESNDDRRRQQRIPINDEFARLDSAAWVSDLSLGGVFVHTEELVPVGTMIELRFTILIEDPVVIETYAKVVRHSHKPRGMGVAFAAMGTEMSERIEQALSHQRPLDSGAPLRLPEPPRLGPPDVESPKPGKPKQPIVFAQPAPVEGLDLRRVHKQEFDDAVTASFPRIETFKPPPAVKAPGRQVDDDDLTRPFPALPRQDD